MTSAKDSIVGLMSMIIDHKMKYSVPREGQVKNVEDETSKGRVLVIVPSLGWDTNDKGVWCYSTDKNMLSTVKVDDWVIIQFVDGNPNHAICMGKSTRILEQIPINYSGSSDSHVLFEDPANNIHMKYDVEENILEIGNSEFMESARLGDEIKSTAVEDSTFWTWATAYNTFNTAWSGALATLQGTGGTPQGVVAYATAMQVLIATLGTVPSELIGKITTGSNQVKVGNQ